MSFNIRFIVYVLVIIMAIVAGISRRKKLDKGAKVLALLLIITLISELSSYWIAIKYKNNFPVYHFFAPIQLFLVGLYFNNSIDTFRKNNLGIIIGLIGLVFAIINTAFIQPINTFNSYFLLFEGTSTIFMSLYAFNRMFISDKINLLQSPHFWFTFIILAFWSITYINWGLYELIRIKMIDAIPFIGILLWIVNIITYSGIGFVFLFYRKKLIPRE